jgi:hypothetical protein
MCRSLDRGWYNAAANTKISFRWMGCGGSGRGDRRRNGSSYFAPRAIAGSTYDRVAARRIARPATRTQCFTSATGTGHDGAPA